MNMSDKIERWFGIFILSFVGIMTIAILIYGIANDNVPRGKSWMALTFGLMCIPGAALTWWCNSEHRGLVVKYTFVTGAFIAGGVAALITAIAADQLSTVMRLTAGFTGPILLWLSRETWNILKSDMHKYNIKIRGTKGR